MPEHRIVCLVQSLKIIVRSEDVVLEVPKIKHRARSACESMLHHAHTNMVVDVALVASSAARNDRNLVEERIFRHSLCECSVVQAWRVKTTAVEHDVFHSAPPFFFVI